MTQPIEAVGGEPTAPAADAGDPFMDIANDMLGDEDEEQPLADEDPVEVEETEAEDEPEPEAEIDELPPIEAPVSWDAEAKAKFAELPRELQETVTKREAERERFVQQKSQEAARAKQEVEQAAYQQLAQYERQVSEQLNQLAQQFEVQPPNPAMLDQNSGIFNPPAFYAQQRQYEQSVAQRTQAQQQAQEYAQQAQLREAEAERLFHAQQYQTIVEAFPEYVDPTSGPELQRKLSAAAKRIGYPDELIQQARAPDILAMRVVAEALEKADKYDAIQKQKMVGVRAAKGLRRVATPGVAQGSDQTRLVRKEKAFERAKTSQGQARVDAFDEYLRAAKII